MLSPYKVPDKYVLYMFLQHWVTWLREFRGLDSLAIPAGVTNPLAGFTEDNCGPESVYHLPGMGVPHSYHET